MSSTITDPIRIKNVELKNRFYAAPMVTNFATKMGYVTPLLVEHHRQTAKGGWGIICVEATAIRGDARAFKYNLGIYDDTCIAGLREIADAIHEGGSTAMIQLYYPGRQGNQEYTLPNVKKEYLAPSSSPPVAFTDIKPREMTTEECEGLAEVYAIAAERAMRAGFDIVQFHAAHGFLIQQFMFPRTNHRTDRFKDPLEFTREIMKRTRAKLGDNYPISMRLSAIEYVEESNDLDFTLETLAPGIEEAGIDWLDIAVGAFESMHRIFPSIYFNSGVDGPDLTSKIKEVISIPVSGRGRINDPTLAKKYVEEGSMDIVAFGRQHISDPHFPKKYIDNQIDDIMRCIACDKCLETLFSMHPIRCTQNYALGRETSVSARITTTTISKRVLIAGGGVAAMQAARVCALRGHQVTLCEKTSKLGGLVNLAASFPNLNTSDLSNSVEFLSKQIRKLKVDVRLNTEVTPEFVIEINPDVVVVATGSKEVLPTIDGCDNSIVVTQDSYLRQEVKVTGKVVVIGGVYGCQAALSLAREGHPVTLLSEEPKDKLGSVKYMRSVRRLILQQLMDEEKKLEILTDVKLSRITDNGVQFKDSNGASRIIEADTVLYCAERISEQSLATALRGTVKELYEIGDGVKPGTIFDATNAAERIARKI